MDGSISVALLSFALFFLFFYTTVCYDFGGGDWQFCVRGCAGRKMTMYRIKGADHWIIAYNTNFGGFFTRDTTERCNYRRIIAELEESS